MMRALGKSTNVWRLFAVLAAALLGFPPHAAGVIIFEKGSTAPLRGYLVEQNDVRVVMRELLPSGETRERILPRSAIEDMIVAVDEKRLAALRPADPEAYRNYAEELAEKREDPDARVAAIRLYLMAAYLKPAELGASSLLGMTALARTANEERKFRAMAYILDPRHDPSLLSPPSSPRIDSRTLSDDDRDKLRALLRLIRTRRTSEARALASRPAVQQVLPELTRQIPAGELARAIEPDSVLNPALLRKILDLEIAFAGAAPPPAAGSEEKVNRWSQSFARGNVAPVMPLKLETLTEFDPRQQYFRDGRWTASPP